MAHDNSEHLRFDSRLATRRGWISAQDRGEMLNALPDVSDKAELLDADQENDELPAVEPETPAAQPDEPETAPEGL